MPTFPLIQEIYPKNQVQNITQEIERLIQKYQPKIQQSNWTLSEKDVVLIAYGDHVQQKNEAPLQTLKKFLDRYFADTISSVHLLPFYPYTSDDGFSVVDYKEVNPALGNWDDISAFSQDYQLMFDAVINHISQASEWFQGYLADDSQYQDFFIDVDPSTDLSQVVRPRALPLLSPFTDKNGNQKHIWTTFSADQVDLNYENPKVFLAVLEVLLFYISKGAKLLRLDAIGFLWKEIGTSCIHLPETHKVIRLMRQVIEQLAPQTILITETNVPHQENISYFGNGKNEAHLVYNFTLPPLLAYSILQESAVELTAWAKTLQLPSDEVCFFNFTASHDGVGVRPLTGILDENQLNVLVETARKNGGKISYKNNADGSKSPYELNCNYLNLLTSPNASVEEKVRRMILSQAVALAMPGLPAIYFHSLVGSENYTEGVKKTGQNRTINREKLDFELLSKELEEEGALRSQIVETLKKLIDSRKEYEVFHPFAPFEFLDLHPQLFAIQRFSKDKSKSLLAVFNLSSQTVFLENSKIQGQDIIGGKRYEGSLSLSKHQFVWVYQDL